MKCVAPIQALIVPNGYSTVLLRNGILSGGIVKTLLDALKNILVLPATNAALFAWGASLFDRAGRALVRPIVVQRLAVMLVRVVVGEPFPGRAKVGVLLDIIDEVGPVETPDRGRIGGVRLGDGDGGSRLFAGNDLLAFVLALVCDRLDRVAGHRVSCFMCHH